MANKPTNAYPVLRDRSSNEWYIVDETDTAYKVFNPHLNLRSSIKKGDHLKITNKPGDYILQDQYIYGVKWKQRNNLPIRDLKWCSENCW